MAGLGVASVDAVVCDPPYGIGWQNEHWDSGAIRAAARGRGRHGRLSPNEAFQVWCGMWGAECARVMKPGAHLLAFGSPRTYHRLACGLEDAGLEVRDTLMWLYSSGMSKSRRYEGGRRTTLKPVLEPVVLARRPLDGSRGPDAVVRSGRSSSFENLHAFDSRVDASRPGLLLLSTKYQERDALIRLDLRRSGGVVLARCCHDDFLVCLRSERLTTRRPEAADCSSGISSGIAASTSSRRR